MRLFLFAIAVGCAAQPATPAAPAPAKILLPDWYGGGAGYGPHWSAWAALAMPLNQAQAIYSYSLYESVLEKGQVPTTKTTTGIATILRQIETRHGTLYVFGLATAGAAVTATASTGAFAGGGFALWKFRKGYTLELAVTEESAGGTTKPVFKAGWGKIFGAQ